MRSSILSLCAAFALGLSLPGSAEEAAPEAVSPSGNMQAAEGSAEAKPAEAAAEAKPAGAAAEAKPGEADAKPSGAEEAKTAAAETAPKKVTPSQGIVLGPVVKDDAGREGRIHEVRSGDTLWEISDAYLGTPWVWPSVWKSNEEIANPHRIFPGDKLFVSPNEMRRLSEEEAARMLAGGQAPAALADGFEGAPVTPKTYRYPEIATAGFITEEQLRGSAAIVDSTVDRVWLGDHDSVIIGLGEAEVQVGDQFDIYRTSGVVDDPSTGVPLGHATLALGWLEVKEVHPETSVAIIHSSRGEIRRGDHLLARVKPGSEIPIGAKPEVAGQVVHTWADRIEMGGNDVVYLNRGESAGLAVGSPLEVFRPIGSGVDEAQQQVRQLPDHVVARMLVVSTTAETATAVVTHSASEVEVGDSFRGSDTIWY
jgi:LysM repeat protein